MPSTHMRSGAAWTMALWASAMVLAGLIIVQLGKAPAKAENRAFASMMTMEDVATRVGDFATLTFNAGSDDVLAILDGRGEAIFYYRVKNQRELEFLGRDDLKQLFAAGRRVGAGRK